MSIEKFRKLPRQTAFRKNGPPTARHIRRGTPIVYTDGDRRVLMFSDAVVQSEMLLSAPDDLVLAYTRAMMLFVLFLPRPRRILLLGLGGGSLAKFCHRQFPDSDITVIELDTRVIGLRGQFGVPDDGPNFRVIHADAIDYVAAQNTAMDVILADVYMPGGMPAAFGSLKFYADCRQALRDGGILVTNLHSRERHYQQITKRMAYAFDQRTCRLKSVAGSNHIYFAVNSPPGQRISLPRRAFLMQRLIALRGGFGRLFNRLLMRGIYNFLCHRSPRV
jgi:spermidine synthase